MEKEMATHSSILARRIPWTEEPGGLQSKGLQKSQTPLKLLTHLGRTGKTKPKDWACGPNLQHSLYDLNFSFLLYESQQPYLSVRVTCTSWENIPGWSSSQIHWFFKQHGGDSPLAPFRFTRVTDLTSQTSRPLYSVRNRGKMSNLRKAPFSQPSGTVLASQHLLSSWCFFIGLLCIPLFKQSRDYSWAQV